MTGKGDKFLYLGILLLFIGLPLVLKTTATPHSAKEGLVLEIVSSGRVIERERLEDAREPRELRLREGGGSNVLLIKDGRVRMASADCPGGDCLRTRPLSRAGGSIVCLPHRLIVRLRDGGRGKSESDFDAVTY